MPIRQRGILYDNTINRIFTNVNPSQILSLKSIYPGISSVPGIGISGTSISNTLIGTWTVPRDLSITKFEFRCSTNVIRQSNLLLTVSNNYVTNTTIVTLSINAASNSNIVNYSNTEDFMLNSNDVISIYTITPGMSKPTLYISYV